jgi:hypothetical protein
MAWQQLDRKIADAAENHQTPLVYRWLQEKVPDGRMNLKLGKRGITAI